MNDQQLERNLQSIGKKCFVTFFKEFCDLTRSNQDVAKQISEQWDRSYTAALVRRVNPAREIIQSGRAKDALICCSRSKRLPQPIRDIATVLAADL